MTNKTAPNIIDFFSGRPLSEIKDEKIVRISPEYDGLGMLYSNENNPDRYFAMRILFWGLRLNGDVVGFVPWLDQVVACPDIIDPLNGQFEGYYDPVIDHVFYDAPMHKVVELETAQVYFESHHDRDVGDNNTELLLQEIPDTLGTHALLIGDDKKTLTLTEVISWGLYADGAIVGNLVDPDKVVQTPIVSGDECLYKAGSNPKFRFYFQHHIANQIKDDNPEALEAIAMLLADENTALEESERLRNALIEGEESTSADIETFDGDSPTDD